MEMEYQEVEMESHEENMGERRGGIRNWIYPCLMGRIQTGGF